MTQEFIINRFIDQYQLAKEQVEQTTSLFVPAPEQFNHRQTHVSDARFVVSALNGRQSVETID